MIHYHAKNGISFSIFILLRSIICFLSIQNLEVIGPTTKLSRSSKLKEDEERSTLYSLLCRISNSSKSSFSISSPEMLVHGLSYTSVHRDFLVDWWRSSGWLCPKLLMLAPLFFVMNDGIRIPRRCLFFKK